MRRLPEIKEFMKFHSPTDERYQKTPENVGDVYGYLQNLRTLSGAFWLSFVCRTMKLQRFFIFGQFYYLVTYYL
jgi:hypothetical protein